MTEGMRISQGGGGGGVNGSGNPDRGGALNLKIHPWGNFQFHRCFDCFN